MKLLVDEEDIYIVKEEIKSISKYYIPESDYYIWDVLDSEIEKDMINKVLYLITFSIPICILLLAIIVKVSKFLDYKIIIGYIVVVCVSIYFAYYFGIKKVENDEIVDVLKDESI